MLDPLAFVCPALDACSPPPPPSGGCQLCGAPGAHDIAGWPVEDGRLCLACSAELDRMVDDQRALLCDELDQMLAIGAA